MKKIKPWLSGSRPIYLPFSLFPYILGSILGCCIKNSFDILSFLLFFLIISILHASFSFLNDYFDLRSDKINIDYSIFSGGSRILVNNEIKRELFLNISIIIWNSVLIISMIFLVLFSINYFIILMIIILLIFYYLHSCPPFSFSYKYFGEGILGVLPVIIILLGAFVQNDSFHIEAIMYSVPICILTFGYFVLNQFHDFRSDRMYEKKTLVNKFGREKTEYILISITVIFYLIHLIFFNFLIGNFVFIVLSIFLAILIAILIFYIYKLKKDVIKPKYIKKASLTYYIIINYYYLFLIINTII